MAITVNQQPQDYTPTYNQIVMRVESDNAVESQFRYKVETYYDRTAIGDGTLASTQYFYTRPDTDTAIIDSQRILENYLEQTLIDNLVEQNYGQQLHPSDGKACRIRITEQYGDPLTDDDSVDIDFVIFNGAIKYQDFITYDYEEYLMVDTETDIKFLTNAPTQKIQSDEQAQLSWIQETSATLPSELVVKVYEADGTLQNTYTSNLASGTGSFDDVFSSFLVGMDDIENTTWDSGTLPAFDSDSSYYTVTLSIPADIAQISEVKRYNIIDNCNDTRRVHFLNRLGGMDSYTFTKKSTPSSTINRMETQRTGYLFEGDLTNNLIARGKINYNIEEQESIKVVSNWLTNEEVIWLKELMTSPEIFLQVDTTWQSVRVVNYSSYEVKTRAQHGTFNLEVELEYAYKSNSQRA